VCLCVVHCVALCCNTLQCAAVQVTSSWISHWHVRVCCSVLQCVPACSSVLQCIAVDKFVNEPTGTYVCVAVCCSVLYCCSVLRLTGSWIVQLVRACVLQCVAVYRSVSQCVAVHGGGQVRG